MKISQTFGKNLHWSCLFVCLARRVAMILRVGEKGLGTHVHAQRCFPLPSLNRILLHDFITNEEEEEGTHDASWKKESMIRDMLFLSSLLCISLLLLLPYLPVLFPLLVPHRAPPHSSLRRKEKIDKMRHKTIIYGGKKE